jgi:2-polyprenyl-3-methyl-5-hydroxy-6-metoxy-1,4-benzoquinol methylase
MNRSWLVEREQCPACTSTAYRILYRCPYGEDPLRLYLHQAYGKHGPEVLDCLGRADYILCECAGCGLVYQKQIPTDALAQKIYEQWREPGAAWRQHDDVGFYARYAQEVMQAIAYFRMKPSGLKFLDFGMGWGNWALMTKAFGCECYGMEVSDSLIQHAKAIGIAVVDWDDVAQYQFDFVNTEQVFEHLGEPLRVLQHLRKCLKPGGLLKISVPTAIDIKRRLRSADWSAPKGSWNSLNPVAPLEHVNLFRRHAIAAMAGHAGMECVSMPVSLHYRFVTDWKGITRSAKNIILPLYRRTMQNYVFLRNMGVVSTV